MNQIQKRIASSAAREAADHVFLTCRSHSKESTIRFLPLAWAHRCPWLASVAMIDVSVHVCHASLPTPTKYGQSVVSWLALMDGYSVTQESNLLSTLPLRHPVACNNVQCYVQILFMLKYLPLLLLLTFPGKSTIKFRSQKCEEK